MAQFVGKIPPPWQTRPQTNPIQNSLLGQHPASAGPIPNQQIVIGAAPQTPQYAPVQQSMIQPPGLGGLQSITQPSIPQPHLAQHNLPQSICSSNLAQATQQPTIQVSLPQSICQGSSSLMGQPPLNSQNLPTTNLVSHSQLVPSQMQQIQPQVTTVAYPTPRALAPPGSFSSQGAPVNLAANLNNNSMQAAALVVAGPPSVSGVGSAGANQPPQKQRVFTGVITKLCADFGFVDEDVFFQTSCVKGPAPKVADRVLVEATYNPNMPFKWNANRVQVIPGSINSSAPSGNRGAGPRENSRNVSFNAVPPPNFSSDNQNSSGFSGRATLGPRARSPRRDRRDEGKRGSRDRPDRDDKEKELKRENRKRSRSRDRSRSPARRRARIIPRYNVQVPKIMLHMKEANVLELRKRYSNLYVPSDVFLARPLWSETFAAHRSFQFPRPVAFHIMNKEVDPISSNDAVYDLPDINHSYAAKVMLMAVPPLDDIYRRSCALSEDPNDTKSCFVHPTRLINFLVGLKGKNETMAIGGYWSPSMDGQNPDKDPNVLIHTAIRTCKALTGIDLSGCTTWYRFAEIYYRRGESTHKGRVVPARVETTVLFLPDVWNICPTKLEWDSLQLNYRRQLDRRLQSASGAQQQQQQQPSSQQAQQQQPSQQGQQQLEQEDQEEEEDGEDKEAAKKDPTHWASLDPKNMKVLELRSELDARLLNSKGLKSQLIARLTKALKVEQEKEEQEKAAAEIMETDESQKKDEEERKREEERKKKEEEEKRKEEEEKRRAEERERSLLEKRYTLPEQPMVVVHPSRSAKSGKFDCTTMSLSVLLDYRQEDNKEHSFEVSLFAELFNEMLMRDFSFNIYKSLVEAPDKIKEEKRDKSKELERKDEKEDKEDEKKKKDEKEKEEEKEDKKLEKKVDKEELKEEKDLKKEEFDEDEEMEEEFEEEMDDDDAKDGSNKSSDKDRDCRDSKDKEKRKCDRKDTKDNRREKKEKRKMTTIDPHLLLSFVYFDQTHTGYIVDKDLEDIINILGLNLSRAQVKKLMTKVLSRDVLYYRKLTDLSVEERTKQTKDQASTLDFELLAKGNNHLLPFFNEPSNLAERVRKSPRTPLKDEPVITSTGVVKYEGSLVDISKLMQQLERSERARSDTEERLKELQKDLGSTKEEARKFSEKNTKSSKEIKSLHTNLKTMDEELKRVLEDNSVYQRALNQIKSVIRPLVAGVDLDDEELMKEEVKVKVEGSKNGYVG